MSTTDTKSKKNNKTLHLTLKTFLNQKNMEFYFKLLILLTTFIKFYKIY